MYQDCLYRIEKTQIGTYEVGFLIGPRLNAAGRIKSALDSLRLLCTRDRSKAARLAGELGKTNRQRQKKMKETVIEAREAWLNQKRTYYNWWQR